MKRNKLLGLGLGFVATCFIASFYIVTRSVFGNHHVNPMSLSFVRFALAVVFFIAVLACVGKGAALWRALREDWRMFALLGFAGVFAEGALQFYSLKYTTAGRCCLFANTSPILTVIIAAIAVKETISKRKWLGMTVGFAGVAVVIATQEGGDMFSPKASVLGDVLSLASAVCWSAYTVWGENVVEKHGGLIASTAVMLLGSVIFLIYLLAAGQPLLPAMPATCWIATLYLGVCATGAAYVCWFIALRHLKPGELGAFGYVSVLLTIALAYLILQESITPVFILAGIFTLFGVFLMMDKPKPEEALAEKLSQASD